MELFVGPLGIVLWSILPIPGMKIVRWVYQGGDDYADGQVKVSFLGVIEPCRDLHGPQRGLDVQRFLEHGLDGYGPDFVWVAFPDQKVYALDTLGIACRGQQLAGFFDGGGRVNLVGEPLG